MTAKQSQHNPNPGHKHMQVPPPPPPFKGGNWQQQLNMAIGQCIQDQRNGLDVLASASWDRVVEIWAEGE